MSGHPFSPSEHKLLSMPAHMTDIDADYYALHRFRRKRSALPDDSVASDLAEIEQLKRLKLEAKGAEESRTHPIFEEYEACQALIVRPVVPSEDAFRLAVCADLSDSTLAKLIRDTSSSLNRDKTDGMRAEPSVQSGEGPSADSASHDKQLVIYQPPPLAELLKTAAHHDEHRMDLD